MKIKRANYDPHGQFYVGAAVGAKEEDVDRAMALVKAGCDVLVLDIANGHSDIAIDGLIRLKEALDG